MLGQPWRDDASAAALCLLLLAGCTSIPRGRAAVAHVEIRGAQEISGTEIADKLATRASPRFLGLIPGFIYDPEIYNPYLVETDLERVERYYEERGFYAAIVRSGLVRYLDDSHVEVSIEVQEGEPTRIRKLEIAGIQPLPEDIAEAVHAALREHLEQGARFEQTAYLDAEQAIWRALTDHGYAYASVSRSARVDLRGYFADVRFDVTPGEPAVLGAVNIQGLAKIPEAPLRRALALTPGEPYSTTALEEAQQAALELGVFSSVEVRPLRKDPPPTPAVIPIDIITTPTELKTVRLGAGLQLDTLQLETHLFAGWEHGNFLGGLRRLSLEVRPGVTLYPTRLGELSLPEDYLPELGLLATLRQPGFLEARTSGSLRVEYNIYAVLNALNDGDTVLGYREARTVAALERPFGRHVRLQPSHNLQTNTPFAYIGELAEDLESLVISYSELLLSLDFRDHIISPRKGARLQLPLQLAGLVGDAADLRLKPDLSTFLPLGHGWTLALRGSIGALFPFNYARAETSARDAQIVFFRGFFAGGPSSNRGYSERGIGPHGALPFLYVDGIDPCSDAPGGRDDCEVALGGFSVWEASIELRYARSGPLDFALFCDAADVARTRLSYSLDRPHLSCGPGIRYATPVGPLRADLGVRVPGLQTLPGEAAEPDPPELFGLPVALAIGIGEAF
jgi:outer membrane protein insertion porin family/translocation and assembly module TamA